MIFQMKRDPAEYTAVALSYWRWVFKDHQTPEKLTTPLLGEAVMCLGKFRLCFQECGGVYGRGT